jgi:hypothetical protein
MSKHKDPLLAALENGESITWTIPEGGDLASMRAAIKHGQTVTMSPVRDVSEVQVGDLVLVRWHKGLIYHLVGEIRGDQFLIINSVGKINGWVHGSAILGHVTEMIDPEPRPSLTDMLARVESAYQLLITQQQLASDDAQRLQYIVDDLAWYAARLGQNRSDVMPKSNVWSFEQNLWRLMRQTESLVPQNTAVERYIDAGKICVGLAAKIVVMFEQQ